MVNHAFEVRHVRCQCAAVVFANCLLERRDVLRLHLLQHRAMLGLRQLGAVDQDVTEIVSAHAIPVVDRALHHVVHDGHVGEAADAKMKARVDFRPVQRRTRVERAVHFGDTCRERFEVGRRCSLGRNPRRHELETFEEGEHFDNRRAGNRGDGGTDVGDTQYQPLGLQQPERLAHGDDADLELTRQVVDDETGARCKLAAEDGFAQRRVGKLLLGQVARLRRRGNFECVGSHTVNRVFCLTASLARMHARAESSALSVPHESGVPTRIAEQNR